MGQVVEDIVEKKIATKVFFDQWSSFTKVISLEFTPCLSFTPWLISESILRRSTISSLY